jgi:molecular chaperone IbpA
MRTFDFSPLFRSTVGFDRLVPLLDAAMRVDEGVSYPPYNIEKLGENDYRITMAVAGFAPEDLNIEVRENTIVISGGKTDEVKEGQYLHRGIAARSFERRFQLADHVQVKGASIENGLLHVDLVREIPERMKPRKIEIAGSGQKAVTVEGKVEETRAAA